MYIAPKHIKELTSKKHRTETGLFLVEGEKNILELLHSDFEIVTLWGTKSFLNIIRRDMLAYEKMHTPVACTEVTESMLTSHGSLLSNNTGLAVAQQKAMPSLEEVLTQAKENIVVVLDDIRDPGNLGTIIRTADWYGVLNLVASPTTTDFYNPKVISATMGSFTRMGVSYMELDILLKEAKALMIPVIGADMEGVNTHNGNLPQSGFLVMGSESHGVSKDTLSYATHTVTIPQFGHAESLNVSVATGILLDTLKRNTK